MPHPPVNEEGAPFLDVVVVDQTALRGLQEHYPFREAEVEILVRCHEHLFMKESEESSFLVTMATASPYSVFFLPDYTVQDRVTWLEEHVLPAGFSHLLYTAIVGDDESPPSLETFLQGVTNATKRPKEALRVLYRCCEGSIDPEAAVADLAVRLVVATQLWQSPNVPDDENAFVQDFQHDYSSTIIRMTEHLRNYTNQQHKHDPNSSSHITTLTERNFVTWAEEMFPMLYTSLGCFLNNLLFHGLQKDADDLVGDNSNNMTLLLPEFQSPSEIVTPGLAMSLAWMDPRLSGKFHRLYSSLYDGRSFNRLLHAILGYEGPTCVLMRTTRDAVVGAFTNARWRACRDTSHHDAKEEEAFLVALQPALNVYRRTRTEGGNNKHVWYLYSHELQGSITHVTSPEGLGWGGTSEMPRLWIPSAFEGCHAGGWDRTYQLGPLLPDDCCERFEIKCLEVWAVGGEERIEHGLAKRDILRQQTKHTLDQARIVHDKRVFVQDLQQMPLTKVFEHQATSRGRHDFVLDEKHGGYKIEDK